MGDTAILTHPVADAVRRVQKSMETPDERLVAECRAGRKEAYNTLIARHYDRIYRLAFAMTSQEDARDLTQETFMAAVKALPHFRGESQLSTWLISILRNQYSLYLRGRRKWKLASLEGESDRLEAPEPDTLGPGVRSILERIKDLPDELRMTLVLFYVEGLKYTEIAAAMDCPLGTVRSRLFEARDRLKKALAGSVDHGMP